MCMQTNKLPFNLNLDNEIQSKKISFIKNSPLELEINNILSNSFGFGGTNVSLIFSKYKESLE